MEWWNRYLKTRSDAADASYDMKEQTIPQMWDVINKPILQGLPVTNGVDPDYWKRNLGATDAARYSGHPLAAMSILDPNLAGETAKAAAGFLPFVGGAVDAYDMSTDKSQRTPLNMGLGMLGAAGDVAKPALGAMAFAGTFAGRKAKTADLDALKEAEKLTAEGETPYMVWLKTKWFQGADSKWRFEIDDSSANHAPKMNTFDHADQISREETGKGVRDLGMNDPRRPNIFERARILSDAETTNLGSRLDHPALYQAYPELSDYPAKTMIVEGSHSGSFSPHTKKVEAIGSDNDEVTSILMHEAAGHGVQDIEGFASGGSPEMIKKVQGQARARMRSLKNGLADLKRVKTQYPVGSDQYKEATELEQQVADAIANTKRAGYVGLDPSSSYDRLAGEVEARQVQGRLDMSQKKRDASFPMQGSQIWDHATMDYPPEEQLLRFDSKAIRNDPTILDRDDVYRSTDYRIQHTAPTGGDDGSVGIDKIDDLFPDFTSLDSRTRSQYYGLPQEPEMVKALDQLASYAKNPDADVTIYRVVPENIDDINSGDWVTQSKHYAEMMLHDQGIKNPKILERKVKSKDLYWNGDSPVELGWKDPDDSSNLRSSNKRKKKGALAYA